MLGRPTIIGLISMRNDSRSSTGFNKLNSLFPEIIVSYAVADHPFQFRILHFREHSALTTFHASSVAPITGAAQWNDGRGLIVPFLWATGKPRRFGQASQGRSCRSTPRRSTACPRSYARGN